MENKGGFLYCWQLVAVMDHGIDILSMAKLFQCIEFYTVQLKFNELIQKVQNKL